MKKVKSIKKSKSGMNQTEDAMKTQIDNQDSVNDADLRVSANSNKFGSILL